MKTILIKNTKWIFLVIQILFFIGIILPGSFALKNTFFFIPFLIVEIFALVPFLYKKKMTLFYFCWQFQLFLFLLFQFLFNPNAFFDIENIPAKTLFTFILVLVIIEIVIASYILLKERAIKKILFTLSLSTTIVVFLIVVFIANEGYPAFQENDPINFLTGTNWQPFYSGQQNDTIPLNTTIKSYDFSIQSETNNIYITPNKPQNITLNIINTGGENDTYTFFASSPTIKTTLNTSSISIKAGHTSSLNITVFTTENRTFQTIDIVGISNTIQHTHNLTLHCIPTLHGFKFTPKTKTIESNENIYGGQNTQFHLTNIGEQTDTYNISIQAPFEFSPIIDEINSTGDYKNFIGSISLNPGESQNLTVFPKMVTLAQGIYKLNITVQSQTQPKLTDTSTIDFHFGKETFYSLDSRSKIIPTNGRAHYTIILNQIPIPPFPVTVKNITSGWSSELFFNGKLILNNTGTAFIEKQQNETYQIDLWIIPPPDTANGFIEAFISINNHAAKPTFGALPFIVGTFFTTCIAVLIAAPLGLGCAIFLAEYCPRRIRIILRPLYELLAGIPSIIYGLWGVFTVGPLLRDTLYPIISNTIGKYLWFFSPTSNMGRDIFTASFVLSIMILPIIITLSEDAISVVRRDLKEGSLALGATRWQTMRRVILPEAKSGIVTSVILSTGRAIGETMAVLMIMSLYTKIPTSLFDSAGTMTSVIAATLGWAFSADLTRHALFAIALILFIMIFILNILVFIVQKKSEDKQFSTSSKFLHIFKKIYIGNLQNKKINSVKSATKNETHSQKKFIIVESINGATQPMPYKKTDISYKAIKKERIIRTALTLGACLVTILLFYIIGDIILKGGLALRPEFLFQREESGGAAGGFANALIGSLQLVSIAIAFAAPLSIGAAIYVQEYTKKNNMLTKIILFASDTLASTPSIVFGAFGFMFFVIFLEFNFSMLAGGLTLGIMIIPLLLRSSIESIKAIPREYEEGAYALGATKWQSIRSIILPAASPGISSGAIISIGRAIGETAAVIFTAGYSASVTTSILSQTASMPNMIYNFYQVAGVNSAAGAKVYSAAFILIIMVLLLNLIARLASHRASRMMKH